MFTNIIGWLVIVALAVLFALLARRAWRAKNRFVKWAGVLLSGLLARGVYAGRRAGAGGFF